MRRSWSFFGAVALASLAAGPIFTISVDLALGYIETPRASVLDTLRIVPVVLLSLPIIAVGFLLSVIPNLIGSGLLTFTGRTFPAARPLPVWIGTGALFGTAIAWKTGGLAEPAYAFALIFTSACCAAICRLSARRD